ncbi:large-conductance mechanosensitive channel protein MscL [Oscillospiraceae bacterium CM]|nr:large-conductance mechanosensitive channel protein MscL [Oscillospiraceae bacterium CM]
MKKLISEFKSFAMKGNVMDLAVGVIIGAAFSKIISSLVNDIAMPFIGMFLGGVDFSSWVIDLPRFFGQQNPIVLKLGVFINTVIEFLILAVVVFMFIKLINSLKKKEKEAPSAPPEPTREEVLLTEIRDILRDKKD